MIVSKCSKTSTYLFRRLIGAMKASGLRAVDIEGTASDAGGAHWLEKGFTVVELLIVMGILGTLASIATPKYMQYQEKVKITIAIADISTIGKDIIAYELTNGQFPDSLADAGVTIDADPWGKAYQYTKVEGTPQGQLRKDRFMVPVNSDFDLYSMGPDGASTGPFTAKASRDDIVRANDGGFIGTVENF